MSRIFQSNSSNNIPIPPPLPPPLKSALSNGSRSKEIHPHGSAESRRGSLLASGSPKSSSSDARRKSESTRSGLSKSTVATNISTPPRPPPPPPPSLNGSRSKEMSGTGESRRASLSESGSPKSSSSDARRKSESTRSGLSKSSVATKTSTPPPPPPPLPSSSNGSSDEELPGSPENSKASLLESRSQSDARRKSESTRSDSTKGSGATKISTLYIPPLINSSSKGLGSEKVSGSANNRKGSTPESGGSKSSSSDPRRMSDSIGSDSSKKTGAAKVSVPLSSSSNYAPRPQPDSPWPASRRDSSENYVEPEVSRNDVPFFEDEDCIDPEDAYSFPCCVPPHSPRYPPNPRPPQEWDPSFLPTGTNIPDSIGTLCRRCGKEVYLAEMHLSSRGAYHTECYKCCLCGKSLDSMSVAEYKGEVFCKGCYRRNFATQGTGQIASPARPPPQGQ